MAIGKAIAGAVLAGLVLLPVIARAEQCLRGEHESRDERARRALAVGFVSELNAAEKRRHREQGSYVPIHELGLATGAPLGFVPRLVFDRFGYVIRVTDFFDSCGFTLFSDERGVIYEAYPTMIEPQRRAVAPDKGGEDARPLQPDEGQARGRE